MPEREYVIAWSQTAATAAAKANVRPADRQRNPDSTEIVAFWVESHPECITKNIVAGTGLSPTQVSDALYRLKRQGRIAASHRQYEGPRPVTWRVVEE